MANMTLLDALNASITRTKTYIDTELAKKADSSHGTHLTLGTGSENAYRGDYGNIAYTHSQVAHAPSDAQKNSDITKEEIEAKLTGTIESHTHNYASSSSAGGAADSANKVNQNLAIKLNGGATEGTDLFTFNGSATKTVNITPSAIGAAADSHNHTSLIGITDLSFSASDTDVASIGTTIVDETTYMDFYLDDDTESDIWRWRFGAWDEVNNIEAEIFNAMTLEATSTTESKLDVSGVVSAKSFTENGTALSDKYAATSHTHSHLEIKGTNTITSTTDDTTANWGAQKSSVHWYRSIGQLTDQPAQYGYLLNIGQDSEVHQLWMTQASGDLKHRGGNASGWSGTWRTLLDTSNFETYAATSSHTHNYLPLSGGTMTGDLKFTDVTSTTYPAVGNKITWNGSTDGVDLYYQVDASDKGRLMLNTRDDSDCVIAFANSGTIKSTIDNNGNFSGNAATATTASNVNGLSLWTGTKAEYDAITSKSDTTLYFIKEG